MPDMRPDYAKRLELARIARGFKSAKKACEYFGWNYNSYAQHEQGNRGINRVSGRYSSAYRVSEAWLLTGVGVPPVINANNEAHLELDEFNTLIERLTDEQKIALLPILRFLIKEVKK